MVRAKTDEGEFGVRSGFWLGCFPPSSLVRQRTSVGLLPSAASLSFPPYFSPRTSRKPEPGEYPYQKGTPSLRVAPVLPTSPSRFALSLAVRLSPRLPRTMSPVSHRLRYRLLLLLRPPLLLSRSTRNRRLSLGSRVSLGLRCLSLLVPSFLNLRPFERC